MATSRRDPLKEDQLLNKSGNRRGMTPCRDGCACSRHAPCPWITAQRVRGGRTNSGCRRSDAHKAAISAFQCGRPKSKIMRQKLRVYRLSDQAHDTRSGGVSRLSRRMIETFLAEFPEVIPEQRFGRCFVDAYLPPPYHLAFEADGEYWHERTERERPGHQARRDRYLLEEHWLPVVHLTEIEILEARRG